MGVGKHGDGKQWKPGWWKKQKTRQGYKKHKLMERTKL
jgi:hypothetical protein